MQDGNSDSDVTMGSYDVRCELVGLFMYGKLSNLLTKTVLVD